MALIQDLMAEATTLSGLSNKLRRTNDPLENDFDILEIKESWFTEVDNARRGLYRNKADLEKAIQRLDDALFLDEGSEADKIQKEIEKYEDRIVLYCYKIKKITMRYDYLFERK